MQVNMRSSVFQLMIRKYEARFVCLLGPTKINMFKKLHLQQFLNYFFLLFGVGSNGQICEVLFHKATLVKNEGNS